MDVKQRIEEKYKIDISEDIFGVYGIKDKNDIHTVDFDELKNKWERNRSKGSKKGQEKAKRRYANVENYHSLLEELKKNSELLESLWRFYANKEGEMKSNESTAGARDFFRMVERTKRLDDSDVDFYMEYFGNAGGGQDAVKRMFREDFESQAQGDSDCVQKLGNLKFSKEIIQGIHNCIANYEKAIEDEELRKDESINITDSRRLKVYEYFQLEGDEGAEESNKRIQQRMESLRSKVREGANDSYRTLIDSYNKLLQELLPNGKVKENFTEFKLLMRYPVFTPYMYLAVQLDERIIEDLYLYARRKPEQLDENLDSVELFKSRYIEKVYKHFGIKIKKEVQEFPPTMTNEEVKERLRAMRGETHDQAKSEWVGALIDIMDKGMDDFPSYAVIAQTGFYANDKKSNSEQSDIKAYLRDVVRKDQNAVHSMMMQVRDNQELLKLWIPIANYMGMSVDWVQELISQKKVEQESEIEPIASEIEPIVSEIKPIVAEIKPTVAETKPTASGTKPTVAGLKAKVAQATAAAERKSEAEQKETAEVKRQAVDETAATKETKQAEEEKQRAREVRRAEVARERAIKRNKKRNMCILVAAISFIVLYTIVTMISGSGNSVTSMKTGSGSTEEYEYYNYGDNVTLTSYIGSETEVEIPSTINNVTVTSIGNYAFSDNVKVTKVTIPETIETIEYNAFNECLSLTEVVFAEESTIAELGSGAFVGCISLKEVTLPDSLLIISIGAFSGCSSLSQVTLPEGLITIDDSAFENSGLTSITIPSTVQAINNAAFKGCTSLASVTFIEGESNAVIEGHAFNGCIVLTSIVLPENYTSIGWGAFKDCSQLKEFTWEYDEDTTTAQEIGDYAFDNVCEGIIFHFSGNATYQTVICTEAATIYAPAGSVFEELAENNNWGITFVAE